MTKLLLREAAKSSAATIGLAALTIGLLLGWPDALAVLLGGAIASLNFLGLVYLVGEMLNLWASGGTLRIPNSWRSSVDDLCKVYRPHTVLALSVIALIIASPAATAKVRRCVRPNGALGMSGPGLGQRGDRQRPREWR